MDIIWIVLLSVMALFFIGMTAISLTVIARAWVDKEGKTVVGGILVLLSLVFGGSLTVAKWLDLVVG